MWYSKKAILMIHGFAGGTWDLENLANDLQYNKEFDVFSFTLPGHDMAIMANIKRTDWINKVDIEIQKIIKKGYQKIYLVGHSMGGVLAVQAASKHREVQKTILIAPAFKYLIFKDNGSLDISKSLITVPKIVNDYGTKEIISRALKVPIPILREFMKLCEENYKYIEQLSIPTMIIYGEEDHLVPKQSIIKIYNDIFAQPKVLLMVKNKNHMMFNEKYEEIYNVINQFLKRNHYKEKEKIINMEVKK